MLRPMFLPLIAATLCLISSRGQPVSADDEAGVLRARIRHLEAQCEALRAEVLKLGGSPNATTAEIQLVSDLRRLEELAKRLDTEVPDAGIRKEAAALAERLALSSPNRANWRVLVKTGVLRDGMVLKDAERLLGPPSDRSDERAGWYHNPHNVHVAPYLYARLKGDQLSDWKLIRR